MTESLKFRKSQDMSKQVKLKKNICKDEDKEFKI